MSNQDFNFDWEFSEEKTPEMGKVEDKIITIGNFKFCYICGRPNGDIANCYAIKLAERDTNRKNKKAKGFKFTYVMILHLQCYEHHVKVEP